MNLQNLLTLYRHHFEALGQAWLASGAECFSVWEDDRLLAAWPDKDHVCGSSITSVPLQVQGHTIGELRVSGLFGPAVHAQLQAEAGLLSSLAPLTRDLNGVTFELVNVRDQMLAIYNLTHSSRNALDVKQALKNLVSDLPRLGRSESAFVLFQQDGEAPILLHFPRPVFSDDDLWEIAAEIGENQHLLFSHKERGSSWPESARNMLVLKISMRGARVAILGLINKKAGEYMMPDIKLARAIADYAGAQLENVLMFQENMHLARLQTEMELAQRVQLSLLPKEPPRIEGLDIFASSIPASMVGGDFYDFIVRQGFPLTFAVGDLSGKGFPAALLMSMTRTVVRTETSMAATPEDVLRGLNGELYDDFTRLSSFATLFIGQYEPGLRELRYANAGHSPVVLCLAQKKPHLLIADGTGMGILPESQSKDQVITLNPGDILVVGTDGLIDAINQEGHRFGYNQFLTLVESLADCSAQEISDGIFDAVRRFSDRLPQEDDQTLLVLKCVQ